MTDKSEAACCRACLKSYVPGEEDDGLCPWCEIDEEGGVYDD